MPEERIRNAAPCKKNVTCERACAHYLSASVEFKQDHGCGEECAISKWHLESRRPTWRAEAPVPAAGSRQSSSSPQQLRSLTPDTVAVCCLGSRTLCQELF
eukprot:2087795-Amphidinium_carterae.1